VSHESQVELKGNHMNRLGLVAGLFAGLCAGTALAAEISLGKYTLAPGEKKTVTLDATGETTVGFTNMGSIEDAKKCKKTCIRMSVPGNPFLDAAAAIGTSMKIKPTNGKIEVLFENLEAFPISIDVFRE
jgi:hypothetical protein